MEIKTKEEAIKSLKDVSILISNDIIPTLENFPNSTDYSIMMDEVEACVEDLTEVDGFMTNQL